MKAIPLLVLTSTLALAQPTCYYTRKGEWAGPGGVGGTPENGPQIGKLRNVPAYAPAGGFPDQNQP